MADITEEISKLENQISELPAGYISRKIINGKERFYLQWSENGKVKSKYIKNDDYEDVKNKIALRKELQGKLNELKTSSGYVNKPRIEDTSFETKVTFGEDLSTFASSAKEYKKRDCYNQIEKYIYGKTEDKVCVVYGLRRTGKTTLIKQTILSMKSEDLSRSAYIKATVHDTMKSLNRDIKKLRELGIKYLFIDEVTLISDFIETAAILSDIYCAMGMKIVLSGTDSLGFWLSSYGELYDRAVMVHTTYIPFAEHSRLLGIDDIDEYIQYGGTLKAGNWDFENNELNSEDASFRDDESTRAYIDTAICSNIQHSLKCYKDGTHFRHLYDLYEKKELTSAINRLIEHSSHDFLVRILTDEFQSHEGGIKTTENGRVKALSEACLDRTYDLGLTARNLLHARELSEQVDLYEKLDVGEVTKKLVEILEIKNKEDQSVEITETHVEEIHEYLKALDLLDSVEKQTVNIKAKNPVIEIFTQPGMRFCQAKALVYSMMKDETFSSLDGNEREFITNKIIQTVVGSMLEDIVLLDTKRRVGKKCEVFKLQFAAGEFDMVIYNKATSTCQIFEIKHSDEIVENQYKHLIDEEKLAAAEKYYGKITRKCVLYKGKSGTVSEGIEYKNVEEFLKEELR